MNFSDEANLSCYSPYADKLDEIALELDVIFIISVGNFKKGRLEWPLDPPKALKFLKNKYSDTIQQPAESIRNISVAALNPANTSHCVPEVPACYSRRGRTSVTGLKPDLAHIGGSCPNTNGTTGLESFDENGKLIQDCGTSFAAPLVAKTAAVLDNLTSGKLTRETIRGLLFHNAQIPANLKSPKLSHVVHDFVGFGKPISAGKILISSNHSVTLTFSGNIVRNQSVQFELNWPTSIVDSWGASNAHILLTLDFSPPIDRKYGAELIRVDLEAVLQQQDSTGKWKKQLDSGFESFDIQDARSESQRISHGFKWNTVKVYEKTLENVIDTSRKWRLLIYYTERQTSEMPEGGIPFSAILTISDQNNEVNVNRDTRNNLRQNGVEFENVFSNSELQ